MKIANVNLTPNPQGKIQVAIPSQPDYAILTGKITAPYQGGPNASGFMDLPCRFAGAGTDPMGAWAFFDPPTLPVPPGPYTAVVGTIQ